MLLVSGDLRFRAMQHRTRLGYSPLPDLEVRLPPILE
jgi:hypothetical protein